MLPDENTQDYADEAETLRLVEQLVHPHGPVLLEIYFRIVHPNFPIIQKHLFVERYRSGDRTFSPSLVAGMYILALNWWSYDLKTAPYPKPDAQRLEAIAMKSLSLAMERPKLSTIQAGLLLLQRPEADSWSLTTQLVAIGQELGLHLDCSSWSIPHWERGLRKRIAWALYMQDKWSSLIHGRPSHIFSANWAVRPISDDDFQEEGDGYDTRQEETVEQKEENEKGQILFAQMIGLTAIMAEVMDTFYTQTAIQDFANAGKGSTPLILSRAKNVQLKLRKWHEELPQVVKMHPPPTGRLSSTGKLAGFGYLLGSYMSRLLAPRLLCDRDHSPSQDCAVIGRLDARSVWLLHVSQRGEDAPHLRHGLCQPAEARASSSVLVFRLQDQLYAHRYLWLVTLGDRPCARGSRLLQDAVARIPVDAQREQQARRVPRLRGADARCQPRHAAQPRREAKSGSADQHRRRASLGTTSFSTVAYGASAAADVARRC